MKCNVWYPLSILSEYSHQCFHDKEKNIKPCSNNINILISAIPQFLVLFLLLFSVLFILFYAKSNEVEDLPFLFTIELQTRVLENKNKKLRLKYHKVYTAVYVRVRSRVIDTKMSFRDPGTTKKTLFCIENLINFCLIVGK